MAAAKSASDGYRRVPGESRCVAEVGVESRCSQERLGRYATEVQAIAAKEVSLHECHPGTEGGGASRGDQPGSAGAEDDEVVAWSGLRVLPSRRPRVGQQLGVVGVVRQQRGARLGVVGLGHRLLDLNHPLRNPARRSAGHDGRTFAHQAPEEPRAVVLDHQGHRSLVQPVVLRGEPTAASPVAGVEAGVEARQQPVRAKDFRISARKMPKRGQDDFRCEGQGSDGRPGREGPIIGSERDAPGHVAVELPLDTPFRSLLREAGAEAGCEPPAILTVPLEPHWVAPTRTAAELRSLGGCSRSSQTVSPA